MTPDAAHEAGPPASPTITSVAAVARNHVIGDRGDIPWKLPGEQAAFKALTLGHVLVMGRLTYDSIGRPLPGRTTIVVTRQPDWQPPGGPRPDVLVTTSLEEAIEQATAIDDQVFVVGGGEIYDAAMPIVDVLRVTWVEQEPEGDAYFPAIDPDVWRVDSETPYDGYTVVRYVRR